MSYEYLKYTDRLGEGMLLTMALDCWVSLYKKYYTWLFLMLSGLRVDLILDLNGNGIYGFIADEFYCKIYFYLGLFLRTDFVLCSLSVKSKGG